jgi:prephenate dehydrogenase
MTYYLLLKGDTEKDVIYETNVLGEESFEIFYPSVGFMILQRILKDKPEIVETIKILDEKKNPYTIEEFVNKLEQWKIKSP